MLRLECCEEETQRCGILCFGEAYYGALALAIHHVRNDVVITSSVVGHNRHVHSARAFGTCMNGPPDIYVPKYGDMLHGLTHLLTHARMRARTHTNTFEGCKCEKY